MARDLFNALERCTYCSRPAFAAWDEDLVSCSEEVCQTLAFAEMRRRGVARPMPRAVYDAEPPVVRTATRDTRSGVDRLHALA